jgi:hypothetical protein
MDQLNNPDDFKAATDSKAALYFIERWFGASKHPVYFCSLPNDKSDPNESGERHIATRDIEEATAFIIKWDRPGRGLFFCTSTIKPGMVRNKENVAELCGLWADIDFKDVIHDPDTILRRVKALRLPPSIIVSSGHGYHCWWPFKEPLPATPENIERVEAALKQLADLVGGDMKVTQVAALMRLPGSHNSKWGEWNPVELVAHV